MAKSVQPVQLDQRRCVPCEGGATPLKGQALQELAGQLGDGWSVVDVARLERVFHFADFRQALDFVNRVGTLAESEGHHPDLELSWGRVKVILWTHKIKGLHENDFILAARIERL
jgi:4a-hydroxytetrahydrobiopterin dehydratase